MVMADWAVCVDFRQVEERLDLFPHFQGVKYDLTISVGWYYVMPGGMYGRKKPAQSEAIGVCSCDCSQSAGNRAKRLVHSD